MIPYGKQNINKDDISSVIKVMESNYLTQGPTTPKFEKKLTKYCNAKYAVAVINATSALHLACLALKVEKNDIVWTSPITFVASANAARYCDAIIDFVDINLETYNLCPQKLEEKLKSAKKTGKLPKVIIVVHLAGQSCDMKKIHKLSLEYGFNIIEDASHCIGGKYDEKPIGNCEYSDITVFSFHPVKIITTCEGGVCMTNDKTLYNTIYNLRSHGVVRNQSDMKNISHGPWYYEQVNLGYNYRLNDLQAALGISQMERLDKFIKERHKIAKMYDKVFKSSETITTPYQSPKSYSSFHLYIIRINQEEGENRKTVFERLRNNGINVNIHYIPVYKHSYYQQFNYDSLPNAEKYYSEAISLPIFPGLTEKQFNFIIDTLKGEQNYQNLF
jgi:UDP-4-amino-4,6-dideoxy-N-acetyl-beta-L-altrosamine transaminase